MRIVFAGTPEFAAKHLQALLACAATLNNQDSHQIVGVYTQPDRPSGRGKKLSPSPVKKLAIENNLAVFQPESLKPAREQQQLQRLNADIMVVVAYGLLLPQAILDTPKYGCINIHASLLPRWRGAAPIQRAIEAGDTESGITIMQMDAGLDTGDMLHTVRCELHDFDTGGSLHDRLASLGPTALLATLQRIAVHAVIGEEQDNTQSNYAPKITKQEALLNWSLPAEQLIRKVRAFNPFPVAYTLLNNERVRIWQVKLDWHSSVASTEAIQPGTIVAADNSGIRVQTGTDTLLITELQMPGKKRLPVAEVLKSRAKLFSTGTLLGQTITGHQA